MITRNNYEEFFLLYVDNELSSADRQAVERFLDENPDLKEEWELLVQCRIAPDKAPAFPNKDLLFKEAASSSTSITPDNYETWFLSYIDGELDEPSRLAVLAFVRQHPEKSIGLHQLQQTISIPDATILFPDKESLYRKEEKRRIAWLPFARIAVAALVLGALGLLIFHPFRAGRAIAKVAAPPVLTNTHHPFIKKDPVAVTPPIPEPLHIQKEPKIKEEKAQTTAPVIVKVEPPVSSKSIIPVAVDPVPVEPVHIEPTTHEVATVQKPTDRTAAALVVLTSNKDLARGSAINTSFATQALLNRSDDNDDEYTETAASPKKNKLRGIFRKVTRALEKSADREEDENRKVLIGGFQFALK